MDKILSIIIPTYNMEKYLSRCLDSLIIPSIDKLDIIVVNDGSKDNSSKIAHSYNEKFPDSIRVIDKENGNYGSCINVALPSVKGKYVKILDADDTFETDNLEKFIKILEKTDSDLVLTDYEGVNDSGETIYSCNNKKLPVLKDLSEDYINLIELGALAEMHAFTYKSSIFKKFDYKQSEGISYTDSEWIFYPIIHCHSLLYANIKLYKYFRGREGQTMDKKVWNQRLDQFIHIVNKFLNFYDKELKEKEFKTEKYLLNHLYISLNKIYVTALLNEIKGYDEFLILDERVSKHYPQLYKDLEDKALIFKNLFPYIKYWNKRKKNKNDVILKLMGKYRNR